MQGLIFDSHYDEFRGVVVHTRIFEGSVKPGDNILFMNTNKVYTVEEVGYFKLKLEKSNSLQAGEVGYLLGNIKNISDIDVGDTITLKDSPAATPLDGFKKAKPVVFSSIYPIATEDYENLSEALEKLKLNDAALTYSKDVSQALGFGFRCGFLGLLHIEVVQERLEREFGVSIILTAPSVQYEVYLTNGEMVIIDNPANYPDVTSIDKIREPFVKATMITPDTYVGALINLCIEKRGTQVGLTYIDEKRVELVYELPLAEIVYDFYDKLKSYSKGYASFDYEFTHPQETNVVKLDILVNGETVDALSMLVHRDKARERALSACEKLKDTIPRQQFQIAIQGAIGGKIISRETIGAYRKDVTAKCYGGDISRKRKLLEKQKEGKKRMKMVGNVEIPQAAFLSVLKSGDTTNGKK